MDQEWKCTKRTNLYFDKQTIAAEEVSEQNRSRTEETIKKKKRDANVNRKCGIMKWGQSPGKRLEVNILGGVWGVGEFIFTTSTGTMFFERR